MNHILHFSHAAGHRRITNLVIYEKELDENIQLNVILHIRN